MVRNLLATFFIFFMLGTSPLALAQKSKKKQHKQTSIKLNKPTNNELAKNIYIQTCYANAKQGKEKRHGVVVVEMDVDAMGQLQSVKLNKNQSTLSAAIGNCIADSMQNMIIPFRSQERGKKVFATFRF